jgi:hypothetical protein
LDSELIHGLASTIHCILCHVFTHVRLAHTGLQRIPCAAQGQ